MLFAPYPSPPLDILKRSDEIRHILVTRTDHLGDMVLSLPFFRALHRELPQAEVAVMALSPYTAEVLRDLPYVKYYYYHTYDDMAKHNATLQKIRDWGVDLAVGLAAQSMDYKTCYYTGARYRVAGVRVERFLRLTLSRLWLTHIQPCYFKKPGPGMDRVLHEVERTSRLARFMGLKCDDTSLELGFKREDIEWVEHFRNIWGGTPYIVAHIQERLFCDRAQDTAETVWNAEDVAGLIGEILSYARGKRVLITYGPYEERAKLISKLTEAMRERSIEFKSINCGEVLPEKIEDKVIMAGNISLKRWARLIGMAEVVFSPDTGAVHIASAMHRPIVGLYLPKKFSYLTQHVAPWQVPHHIVKKGRPRETYNEIIAGLDKLLS